MTSLFARKPIAELVAEDGHPNALKRELGAGDLIMLAIGAVIGAGIFGAIGTAAAGQIGRRGRRHPRAAPGRRSSSPSCCSVSCCALAALCYAELASMIPQAGSAYAYSYATLGEIVAWIIGWDLILEYAVGNVAVAISWGDYFKSLTGGLGFTFPPWLTTGYRTALLSSDPGVHGLLAVGAARGRHSDPRQRAGVRDRRAHHLAAAARRAGERAGEQHHGRRQAARARRCSSWSGLHAHQPGELHAVRAERLRGHPPGRGDRVLRLHRLRRDLHGRRGDEESAAQPADRHPRRARHLHRHLRDRRRGADGNGAVRADLGLHADPLAYALQRDGHDRRRAGSSRSAPCSR